MKDVRYPHPWILNALLLPGLTAIFFKKTAGKTKSNVLYKCFIQLINNDVCNVLNFKVLRSKTISREGENFQFLLLYIYKTLL